MKKSIYIYGAGGLGREINAMLLNMPEWELAGFYDDAIKAGTHCGKVPCFGGMDRLQNISNDINIVIAIGNPSIKWKIAKQLAMNPHLHFPVLVHPTAQLLDATTIEVDSGCVITAGCILTTNIKIGKHTLINLNTTIGHDVLMSEAISIMPGVNIAGHVRIGKGVLIGSGANILNGLTVADHAQIGAGAVVTKNVEANTTVIGIPAKNVTAK